MGLTLFVGVVVIGALIFPLLGVLFFSGDTETPKPPGYRVRRVIGFAIVAAGVSITFLRVSHEPDQALPEHIACGTSWQAMFSARWNGDYECGHAAFPHLWIAGGVATVGMGIAFWGAGCGRLLTAVCLPLVAALSVYLLGGIASTQMGGT